MVAQIILSLTILVGLHEFGHLIAAKYFGMRVEQFSIGFPPKIFKFEWKGTEYAFSAIPLGGFVKISGMIDESLDTESLSDEPQPWEFRSKPAWQRLIVMLGGIIVNIITGIVIFIMLTFLWGENYLTKDLFNENGGIATFEYTEAIGLKTGDQIIKINGQDYEDIMELINPEHLLESNASYTVLRNGREVEVPIPANFIENFSEKKNQLAWLRIKSEVGTVSENSLAHKLELKEGDCFVKINSRNVYYQDELRSALTERSSDSLHLEVKRGDEILSFDVVHPLDSNIGFYAKMPTEAFLKNYEKSYTYGFMESIPMGAKKAFSVVFVQIKAFGKMFSGELNPMKSLSGPIGIAKLYGSEWDWYRFWKITGLLSMVLAFMNLLPIPALDGGHVAFLSAEIISGRKPSDKFLEIAQKIGMVLLLALMAFIIGNDIIKVIIG